MAAPRYFALGFMLLSMCISGPTIRFVAAPALAVALWRVLLAWPVLACTALVRRERWPWRRGAAAGLFLAWHWVGWVLGVQRTSMASASILISTGVLWAAVLSRPLLGERVSRRQWLGLGLALLGVTLIVTARHSPRHSLIGDLHALSGALAWVAYSFIGRRARQQAGFWGYTATVYLSATLTILVAAVLLGVPLVGFDRRSWVALALLALFPTLLGHGGFNYLLRFMGPARLGLWTLSEPVFATIIAWPLFGEALSSQMFLGGASALLGVGLGVGETGARREPGAAGETADGSARQGEIERRARLGELASLAADGEPLAIPDDGRQLKSDRPR